MHKFYRNILFIFLFISCQDKQGQTTDGNIEMSAVHFLNNEILAKPMSFKAIADEPFYRQYFTNVDFKGKEMYIHDTICNWSYDIAGIKKTSTLKSFPCYAFPKLESNDIVSVSINDFKNKKDGYLILLSRPVNYNAGQYIMLSLFPTTEEERPLLFFITKINDELALKAVGIGSDLESIVSF